MGKIIFVTGGARSGKSSYGETCVESLGGTIGYMATAKITDDDMADRVAKHQASRPSQWATFEGYKGFEALMGNDAFMDCDSLILDCITILITNIMFDYELDYDQASIEEVTAVEKAVADEIMGLLELIRATDKNLVVVSNEVGLGLVPAYRLGNLFRDIAGRMNQLIASEADEAYFIVSGLPLKLK